MRSYTAKISISNYSCIWYIYVIYIKKNDVVHVFNKKQGVCYKTLCYN